MGVSLRVLKQIKQQKSELRQLQCQEQRIDRMPYSYSGLSRAHILIPTTSLEIAEDKFNVSNFSTLFFFFRLSTHLKHGSSYPGLKYMGITWGRNKNY